MCEIVPEYKVECKTLPTAPCLMCEIVPEYKVEYKTLPKNPCLLRLIASDGVRNKMDTSISSILHYNFILKKQIKEIQFYDMFSDEMTLQICDS